MGGFELDDGIELKAIGCSPTGSAMRALPGPYGLSDQPEGVSEVVFRDLAAENNAGDA
jgi:hypothetical protein